MGPFQPGDRCNQFEIVRLIGAGAYGCVYEAKRSDAGFANSIVQPLCEKRVALKCLHVYDPRDPGARDRLHQEGALLAKLEHRNIVDYLELGVTERGVAFFVMELLKGKTLTKRLEDGPMPMGEALQVAKEIADALVFAHEQHGVAHLDLKPCNVFLTEQSEVKVLDLGAARYDYGWTAGTSVSPKPKPRVFTPGYAAPEQINGTGPIDHRADIFALAEILFEMLTGEHAFYGSEHTTRSFLYPAKSLADFGVSEDLAGIVQRALARSPNDRPSSMAELRGAIESALKMVGDTQKKRVLKLSVEVQLKRQLPPNSPRYRAPTVRVEEPRDIFKDPTVPNCQAVRSLRAAVADDGKVVLNLEGWHGDIPTASHGYALAILESRTQRNTRTRWNGPASAEEMVEWPVAVSRENSTGDAVDTACGRAALSPAAKKQKRKAVWMMAVAATAVSGLAAGWRVRAGWHESASGWSAAEAAAGRTDFSSSAATPESVTKVQEDVGRSEASGAIATEAPGASSKRDSGGARRAQVDGAMVGTARSSVKRASQQNVNVPRFASIQESDDSAKWLNDPFEGTVGSEKRPKTAGELGVVGPGGGPSQSLDTTGEQSPAGGKRIGTKRESGTKKKRAEEGILVQPPWSSMGDVPAMPGETDVNRGGGQ